MLLLRRRFGKREKVAASKSIMLRMRRIVVLHDTLASRNLFAK
jgi:hypothetical protein